MQKIIANINLSEINYYDSCDHFRQSCCPFSNNPQLLLNSSDSKEEQSNDLIMKINKFCKGCGFFV